MTQAARQPAPHPDEQHPHDLDAAMIVKYVTFALGNETYGVTAASVNEVLRYTEITPVPGAPVAILGIINLRGNVVTVLDARTLFGLPQAEVSSQSRIVIVDIEDYAVGIVVDRVAEVVDLDTGQIENSPNTGTEAAARFIQGVHNHGDTLIILVDFSQLGNL